MLIWSHGGSVDLDGWPSSGIDNLLKCDEQGSLKLEGLKNFRAALRLRQRRWHRMKQMWCLNNKNYEYFRFVLVHI